MVFTFHSLTCLTQMQLTLPAQTTPKKLPSTPVSLAKLLLTDHQDQEQLSRNITSVTTLSLPKQKRWVSSLSTAVAASVWQQRHTHIRVRALRCTSELIPWCQTSMPHWNCSSAERGDGYLRDVEGAVQALQRQLLTIHSRSTAPQPARGAASILRLPAGGAPRARCGDAVCLSVGFLKGDGLSSNTRGSQAPPASSSPLTRLQAPVLLGLEQQGCLSLRSPSVRVLPLALFASAMPGEEIQTKKAKEGEEGRGRTPTPPSPRKKKKNHHRTGEGGNQKSGGCRRGRQSDGDGGAAVATAGERSLRRRAAWLGGFPVARQLTWRACVCGERAAQPGRTHGLSAARRGEASPERRSASSGNGGGEQETPPPPAPASPGGERGGGKPSLLFPFRSPPRLLLRLRLLLLFLLLTVPLWLSKPFCPALASFESTRETEPTGRGPSAGVGAKEGGARVSLGGRWCCPRCWSWGFAV